MTDRQRTRPPRSGATVERAASAGAASGRCSRLELRRRRRARSSGSAAPTARARRRCCARWPACRAPAAGGLAWRGAQPVAPRPLYLAHANALKEDLSVGESLRFLLQLDGHHVDAADVDAALERFGMASRRDAFGAHPVAGPAPARRPGPPGAAQRELLALAARRAVRRPRRRRGRDANALLAEHARRGGGVVLTSHLPLPIDEPAPPIVDLARACAGMSRRPPRGEYRSAQRAGLE